MVYFIKHAGHCTRCEEPFGGNRAMAYMVCEYVAWDLRNEDLALCQWEWAPVCAACVKPAEESDADDEQACEGCGLTLRSPFRTRTCSDRCAMRALRARRREQRPLLDCTVCGLAFKPKRAGVYCSAACKQKAWRRRHAMPQP